MTRCSHDHHRTIRHPPHPARRCAAATVAALEDAVGLMEQRYADREAVRLGHILRHAATPEQVYTATQAARAEHPEAWAGVWVNTEKVGA